MNKRQRKKCVAVAQDVLDNMRRIVVTEGTYCQGTLPDGVEDAKESAKKHIDAISKGCRVCALGACFLSYIRLYNHVSLGQLIGTYGDYVFQDEIFDVEYIEMMDELREVFTPAQICLIETAFEKACINDDAVADDDDHAYDMDTHTTYDEADAARLFGEKYEEPRQRLRAIMKNIIKNDGLFIPDKQLYADLQAANKPKKRIPVEIV